MTANKQMPRQMSGSGPLKHTLPACPQSPEIETAQMRDLVLNGRFGRGATLAMILPHRIMPPV